MERFSALVLSQDFETLRAINRALEEYGLTASVVRNVRDANEMLKNRRFDLAVCDYDFPGANQLAYLDPGNAWRGMVFAVVRQEHLGKIGERRVHLTMQKPLSQGIFSKGLRAAYTTMVHERRAAFRYPVDVQAISAEMIYRHDQTKLSWAKIINVSRSGMCVECPELLPQHATIRVSFGLPENGNVVSVEGEAVWGKAPGRLGVRFTNIGAASQKRLTEWMLDKLPPEFAQQ
jgi:hypothetical protein